LRFTQYPRLHAYVRSGRNPYLALAEICEAVYQAALAQSDKVHAEYDYCPKKYLHAIEKEMATGSWLAMDMEDSEGGDGVPKAVSAFLVSENVPELQSGAGHLDWIRGFLKDCSDYLSNMTRLSDFKDEPLQRWLFMTETAVDRITRRKETDKSQLVGLEPLIGPKRLKKNKEVVESIAKSLGCKLNDVVLLDVNDDQGFEVSDRLYEVWMELMAACNVSLALLGRSHNDGWSRTLELVQTCTHGFPDGVCTYKATGDVYRKLGRSIREKDARVNVAVEKENPEDERDTPYGRLQDRGNIWKIDGEHYVVGLVQVFKQSLLFSVDDFKFDLTPSSFRMAGAAYCFLQYMACLHDLEKMQAELTSMKRLRVIIVWAWDSADTNSDQPSLFQGEDRKLFIEDPNKFIDHFKKQRVLREAPNFHPSKVGGRALGIDEGVYSPIRSESGNVPYTMREVSDDFHRSFRNETLNLLYADMRGSQSL
jgi:hypothetical protein